jgi:hypothetical protein
MMSKDEMCDVAIDRFWGILESHNEDITSCVKV